MNKLMIVILSSCMATGAFAGGYRVSLQGQKALAMGHTGVALDESAEAIFFNPAGITGIEAETDVVGGLTLLTGSTIYQNSDTNAEAETDNPLGTPLNGYFAQHLNDELSWGFGVYTPYGNKVEWPTDWQGSHLVNYIELQAVFLQPTIAYKISETTSIGFGPNYVIGAVEFNRNLSTSLTDGKGDRTNVTIEASNVAAWGYNLGFQTKPSDELSIGVSYRSQVDLEARNESADFQNVPIALQALFPDTKFDADLLLPAELTIGLAYKLSDQTLIAFDINRTYWDEYKELVIEFDNAAGTSVNARNYKDSSIYRVGVQHLLDEKWTLRGGLYLDESPVQDGYFAPETPRNDSIGYTAGATYQVSKNMAVDISFLLLKFAAVTNSYDFYLESGVPAPFEGTYKSTATSLGLGLSYHY
jgi:long-chain fatty acid transport protein